MRPATASMTQNEKCSWTIRARPQLHLLTPGRASRNGTQSTDHGILSWNEAAAP